MEIMEACQEICLDEAGGEANNSNTLIPQWLDKQYVEVLLNKDKIKEEFNQRERSLGKHCLVCSAIIFVQNISAESSLIFSLIGIN